MTKEELIEYFKAYQNSEVDCPWENDDFSTVARHTLNRKWYAVILDHGGKTVVNLKCDKLQSEFLRCKYKGIYPAYHMNKTHWNSVVLQSDVEDELIRSLVDLSYEITL